MKPSQDLEGFEWIGLPDCLKAHLFCLSTVVQEQHLQELPVAVRIVIQAFKETTKVTN